MGDDYRQTRPPAATTRPDTSATATAPLIDSKRDWTAMVYHDMRAPLHNIEIVFALVQRLLVETAQESPSPEVQRLRDVLMEPLTLAHQSADRLRRMINQLLAIERLEQAQYPLQRVTFDFNQLVARAIGDWHSDFERAGIRVHVEIAPRAYTAYGDPDVVERILSNLLDNAIKHTPQNGHIWLHAGHTQAGAFAASITDSGPGIAPEHARTIFERFAQVSGDSARSLGVGLGLAYCKLAVEAHGGRIWVENVPGAGARFTFTLG
jgi:signal transduction histidine kinase